MKFLVMCEGPNEKAIVDMLLDAECLEFTRDDLVNLTVYHARQLTAPIIKTALSIYTDEFQVYRIGDSMTDKLPVPADYKDRIKGVRKFCTKPELEMLLIIAEGKEAELLDLNGAMLCKVNHSMGIQVLCVAVGADENNNILFYPVGSEQQKQVFPEITQTTSPK